MNKILLDTNAYVKYLTGDTKVLDALGKAVTVNMSVVVLGELYAGFKGGSRARKNRNDLDKFLEKTTVEILDVSRETSEIFGDIKNVLRKSGTPIPINDIWIAANTIESGSALVTYDTHFLKIPGLRTWDS